MADLREVGRLLALRYNVKEVDGPLADAIAAGDVDEVERLISEREMYRWAGPIALALQAARYSVQKESVDEPEPEEAEATSEPVPEPEEAVPSAEVEEPAPEPKQSRRKK